MQESAILAPVLVQALLTFAVLILLGPARARSMRETRTRLDDPGLANGTSPWSDRALRISNNFKNQFELPVLFYAVTAFALILHRADAIMIWLAWAFVATRLAHVLFHVTQNVIRARGLTFLIGAAILIAMWIRLGWRVLAA